MSDDRRILPPAGRRGADTVQISEEQMKEIAEMAANLAVQQVIDLGFKAVGKSVVEKLFWLVGVVAVGLYFWAKSNGFIK